MTFNDAAGTGFTDGTKIATLTPTSFTASNFLDSHHGGRRPQRESCDVQHDDFGFLGNNQAAPASIRRGQRLHGHQPNAVAAPHWLQRPSFFQPPGGTPTLVASVFQSNLAAPFGSQQSPSLLFTSPITLATVAPNIGPNSPATINGVLPAGTHDLQLAVAGITQSFRGRGPRARLDDPDGPGRRRRPGRRPPHAGPGRLTRPSPGPPFDTFAKRPPSGGLFFGDVLSLISRRVHMLTYL